MSEGSREVARRSRYTVAALVIGAMALPAVASAHLERPSFWPDPGVDMAGGVPAGGKVPKARSFGSAVSGQGPGDVRVVCKPNSLQLALNSVKKANKRGFRLRPSLPRRTISDQKANQLRKANRQFAEKCAFGSVQEAVDASGNNDRIVIMPGRYTEPKSRRAPVNDPRCDPSLLQKDQSGADTPSYEYQAKCSNDQNLIYIQGRAVKGDVPSGSPDPDRHGIPQDQLGRCIRCNLQIEGSGARPEDVLLDAGKGYANPNKPGAQPGSDGTSPEDCLAAPDGQDNPCYAKHVVMRGDRTDGFVGRNFLLRGAKEHGYYTEESDGVLLDRVKFYWNADYGHLSFTTDHNVVKNCDGFGSGDAVVYPGAAPQTGEFRDEGFYPQERFNTVIKKCDLHGSAMGYSGSMGNSVRVTRNNVYGNANGLTSDTISAPGHPGFPADGQKVDHNLFYSNNLDIYRDDAPFVPLVPQAIGTGIMWPGMNDGDFSNNRVFDNWQYGTLLVAIPDAVAGDSDGNADSQNHCPTTALPGVPAASTSCANRYHANKMGTVPNGFGPHPALAKFGNKSGLLDDVVPDQLPNGVDFYWDEFPTSNNNCWYNNTGPDGTRDTLTGDPPLNPAGANTSVPGFLPEACASATGSPVYGAKGALLLECFGEWESGLAPDGNCTWYDMPARPGTPAARADQAEFEAEMRELSKTPEAKRIDAYMQEVAGEVNLGPGE